MYRTFGLVLVVALSFLQSGNVIAQTTEAVIFNQCECALENPTFASSGNAFFQDVFRVSGLDEAFSCRGGVGLNGFADQAGVIVDIGSTTTLLSSATNEALFSADSSFYVRQKFSFAAANGASFTLAEVVDSGFVTNAENVVEFGNLIVKFSTGSSEVKVDPSEGVDDYVVTAGVKTVEVNGATFQAVFTCVQSVSLNTEQCGFGELDFTGAADLVMQIIKFNSAAALTLDLDFVQFGDDVTNGNDIVVDEVGDLADAFLTRVQVLQDPVITVLPVVNANTFTIDEGASVEFNLESQLAGGNVAVANLDFTVNVDTNVLTGDFAQQNFANLGVFDYTPLENDNGDQTFTYSYGISSPFVCANNDIPVTLTINAVGDAPTAVNQDVQVFGTVLKDFSAEPLLIAEDVDFVDDQLLDGGVATITVLPAGELSDCNGNAINVGDTLAINAGSIEFCYVPDNTLVNGGTSDFEYTISDNDPTTDDVAGVTTFVGQDPVFPILGTESNGNEDATVVVDLFGLGNSAIPGEIDFFVRITRLPEIGTLTASDGSPIVIDDESAEFTQNDDLIYTPPADFFNANSNGVAETDAGVPIDAPVTFEYEVFRDDINADRATSALIVEAVDDGGATLENNAFEEGEDIVFQVNEIGASNNKNDATLRGMVVTSDNGNDVFKVQSRVTGFGGVQVRVRNKPANDEGFVVISGEANDPNKDCEAAFCDIVVITGVPSQVEEALNDLDVEVPIESEEDEIPTLQIAVFKFADENDLSSLTVDFEIVRIEEEFFDNVLNLVYIGAGGAGLVAVLIGFGIYRVTRAKAVAETNELALAEQQVEFDLRKKRKDKQSARGAAAAEKEDYSPKKNKSLKVNADDEIFDWEKHIDKDTKETYFFNPKTGESRWDPPSVKKLDV